MQLTFGDAEALGQRKQARREVFRKKTGSELTFAAGIAHVLAYDPFGRLAGHTAQGMTTTYTVNLVSRFKRNTRLRISPSLRSSPRPGFASRASSSACR